MAQSNAAAISEIEAVLKEVDAQFDMTDWAVFKKCETLLESLIARLAPPKSVYSQQIATNAKPHPDAALQHYPGLRASRFEQLKGIASALRDDYNENRLLTFRELVHQDLFSDLLELAEYLLKDETLRDPAAVYAGAALESHIRQLCVKSGIPIATANSSGQMKPIKLDTLNAELAKAAVYDKTMQKLVLGWAGIRNSAAHGKFGEYSEAQVEGMILGVRDLTARYPA